MSNNSHLLERYKTYLVDSKLHPTMQDFFLKQVGVIVALDEKRLVILDKPHLETSFCFRDEEPLQQQYAKSVATVDTIWQHDIFIEANLQELKEQERAVKEGKCYILPSYYSPYVYGAHHKINPYSSEQYNYAPQEEIDLILAGIQENIQKFTKRLHTYLKRYGTTKLNVWTYWADA